MTLPGFTSWSDEELDAMSPEQLASAGIIHKACVPLVTSYRDAVVKGKIQTMPVVYDRLMPAAKQKAAGKGARVIIGTAMQLSGGKADPGTCKEWLEKHGTCVNWGEQEWRRGSHLAECATCGKPAQQHLQEYGPGYGSCPDVVIYLHRLCDGSLLKP